MGHFERYGPEQLFITEHQLFFLTNYGQIYRGRTNFIKKHILAATTKLCHMF